jgi:alpha-L-arabinofuranosidase
MRCKKIILSVAAFFTVLSLAGVASAQTLLYQWNFDNGTTTTTTPGITAGGGNLALSDASGSGAAGNTVVFNPTGGPGAGGFGTAVGALVANGQGYNGGNTAVGLGTLTGLGNLSAFTVSFWFKMGMSASNTLPRFVSVGTNITYDAGGKGTGNTAPGFGTFVNAWTGAGVFPATQLQHGVAGSLGVTTWLSTLGGATLIASNTWYYQAITYDGAKVTTYLGPMNSNAVQVSQVTAALGALNFGTNGVILVGNLDGGTMRALSYGSIADVRIYNGAQTLAQLVNVQTNAASSGNTNRPTATVPVISPTVIYVGSSITLTSVVTGSAPIFFQWQTDGSGGTLTNIPGATNSTLVTTPFKTGAFQYDLIVTNSYGSATSAVAVATVQPLAGTANVYVNVASNLSTVAGSLYGMGTAVYDNQNGNAALPNLLIQSGVNTLRYPGGSYSDVFHWSVSRPTLGGANGYGLSPSFGGGYGFGYMGPKTDFGNFVSLLTNSQCQAVITVNYGSGQQWSAGHTNLIVPATNAEPTEAAAWVAYANANTNIFGTVNDVTLGVDSLGNDWKTAGYWAMLRAASPLGADDGFNFLRIGRKTPLGIRYWEIGNETYGTGYYVSNGYDGYSVNYAVPYPYSTTTRYGNTNLSPAAYGKGVKNFSQLMKLVDPTIKIGAVVTAPPDDYSWDVYGGQHWTPQVLAQCATNIDFVIAHWYPYAGSLADGGSLLSGVSATIPTMINGSSSHTGASAGLRDYINAVRPDGTNVQIFITEFGYTGSLTNSLNGEPIVGPVNGLFAADAYANWMELGVSNVDWLEMNKNTFLGDGNPPVPGTTYYAIQLTHNMAGVGDRIVGAVSDVALLRAHAAVQSNGKVGVMLLNENLTNSLTVTVTVPNYTNLASSGVMYQFGTNNFNGGSQTPATGPTTNTISVSGNSVTVTVPPYTMAVLTIPVATNTPPLLAAISNRTVNVGQTVAFTASATDTDSPPQTLTFTLLAGTTNSMLDTNSGAFSFRPLVTQANSTNTFTLMVADNGSPVLSATQDFSVMVNPLTPSAVSSVTINGLFGFKVGGQPGPDYAVQVSTDLVSWTTVFITNSPPMPFQWMDTNTMASPAQFYRIKAGPPLP